MVKIIVRKILPIWIRKEVTPVLSLNLCWPVMGIAAKLISVSLKHLGHFYRGEICLVEKGFL
jgi:hypothetical protein